MASNYIDLPSFGAGSWKAPVLTALALPMDGNSPGDVRVALDTDILYVWTGAAWAAAAESDNGISALTGDGTAVGPGPAVLTLATVNANVGAFGSANSAVILTVNAKGLTTAVGTIAIAIPSTQVTDFTTAAQTAAVQNSLTPSTVIAPSASAVQTALDLKITDPMNTAGDMIYRDGSNVTARLPIGTESQKLQVVSGLPAWTTAFEELFGGAQLGNLTLTGALTLSNDVFYNTLTLNAGAALNTFGYKIFCKTLDLSNAPAGAIRRFGSNGNNAANQTGGGTQAGLNAATLGGGGQGGAGATGVVGVGVTSTNAGSFVNANGGNAGAGGQGGNGTPNAGGASGAGGTATNGLDFDRIAYDLFRGAVLIGGGAGGRGGSSGGGDGTNLGRGGGGGGASGGAIAIYAHTIITSGSTASGAINCVGGNGGLGASATVGNVGGGGGGGGAGGGYIYIMYAQKTGPVVTDLITASGGTGGNGGNGFGTGTGARGGGGGTGGKIEMFNVTTGIGEKIVGVAGVAGGINTGLTGGTGGAGGACVKSL